MAMPFTQPMIWREPRNHYDDCYFCLTDTAGHRSKTKCTIKYADCESATKPVLNQEEDVIPRPPVKCMSDELCSICSELESTCDDDELYVPEIEEMPNLIGQTQLNDSIRDLNLSKEQAELLTSRLKQWNVLQPGVSVTNHRKRGCVLLQ